MKTLYQAANAVEAHMLVDYLKQEGLSAQVLGEHLQGAVGELPAAGLVRLVIDEEQYDAGREAIARWEAVQPADAPAVPRDPPRKGKGFGRFALGLVVGAAGVYAWFHAPMPADGIDHNRDGTLDERWTVSPRGAFLRVETDRNFDGKVDHITTHDENGRARTIQSDDDFDGRFETALRLHMGNVETQQIDTDGDGLIDLTYHFSSGVLQRAEYRDPATGQTGRVEHYRLNKQTHAEVDSDQDGVLDTRIRYTPMQQEAGRSRIER
jgi:hypothetical protein